MQINEFWNSSLIDIRDTIDNYNKKKKADVVMGFMQADVLANRIACILNKDNKVCMPWDYYPEVFREDKSRYEKTKAKEELEKYKNDRRNAMDAYNSFRHGQEVII